MANEHTSVIGYTVSHSTIPHTTGLPSVTFNDLRDLSHSSEIQQVLIQQ